MNLRIIGLAGLLGLVAFTFLTVDAAPTRAQGNYCEDLWYQRNRIFAARGYCFGSPKGQAAFPNSCFPPYGELTAAERQLVGYIKSLEAQAGCGSAQGSNVVQGMLPIIIGGDDYDACASSGEVVGLKVSGDGFLAVRASPNGTEVDQIYNGQQIYLCNQIGGWMGIVYPKPGQDASQCNVSTPWGTRQQYSGPCGFGWVSRKYIRIIAG